MVKIPPAMQETWIQSLVQEDSLGEENGNPLQYSCLKNSMDRGAWRAIVHGVAKCRTQLCTHIQSKFIKQNYLIALKDIQMCYKHMCTHASISAQPHVWIYLSPFIYIHTHIFWPYLYFYTPNSSINLIVINICVYLT